MGGRKIMENMNIFDILAKMHGEWFDWDSAVAAFFRKIADAIS